MTDSTPHSRHAARRGAGKEASIVREVAVIVVVALVLSVLVRSFVAQAFFIPSASMEGTLQVQDRILVSKLSTELSGVHRGEIVVFVDPGGWLPEAVPPTGASGVIRRVRMWVGLLPADTGEDLVKRVIAVAGDHIVCCDARNRIVLNGIPLVESYLKPGDGTEQVRFDVTVPPGRVFVMGDNRGDSEDSRFHLDVAAGSVPVANVVGRVVGVMWPASNWSGAPIPAIFENPALDVAPAARPAVDTGGDTAAPSGEAVP